MLAIKQGGLKGKGPGRSTQRYIVPVMFGDYMFSFIIEEYGLWGAIIIIVLYVSLFARGAIIARNCNSAFAKTAIAGLVLLISGQGFMHMMVNVHMLPQTGQTLPMISHGSSSFLVFSLAFGILLSISRMVYLKVQKEAREAGPIMEHHDEVQASLSDLDMLETNQYDMDTDNLE
jgi:cell division protein FtsW